MPPCYLHLDLPKYVMRNVSRFRLRAHTLAVESSIWRGGSGHCDKCSCPAVQNEVRTIPLGVGETISSSSKRRALKPSVLIQGSNPSLLFNFHAHLAHYACQNQACSLKRRDHKSERNSFHSAPKWPFSLTQGV